MEGAVAPASVCSYPCSSSVLVLHCTPNLPTNIVDFRGFDSSTILNVRGEILMSIGDFLEILSQAMLVWCNVSREIGRSSVLVLNDTEELRCDMIWDDIILQIWHWAVTT